MKNAVLLGYAHVSRSQVRSDPLPHLFDENGAEFLRVFAGIADICQPKANVPEIKKYRADFSKMIGAETPRVAINIFAVRCLKYLQRLPHALRVGGVIFWIGMIPTPMAGRIVMGPPAIR